MWCNCVFYWLINSVHSILFFCFDILFTMTLIINLIINLISKHKTGVIQYHNFKNCQLVWLKCDVYEVVWLNIFITFANCFFYQLLKPLSVNTSECMACILLPRLSSNTAFGPSNWWPNRPDTTVLFDWTTQARWQISCTVIGRLRHTSLPVFTTRQIPYRIAAGPTCLVVMQPVAFENCSVLFRDQPPPPGVTVLRPKRERCSRMSWKAFGARGRGKQRGWSRRSRVLKS